MADKVVKDLSNDFLSCCICMSHFKTPKMLPCIHSFCQECLEKYFSTQKGTEITCPTCRKSFQLPKSGVKDLQTNFHLVNLAEKITLLEKLTSPMEREKLCDSCNSQEAHAFCFDCNFAICSECKSHHALFPVLRSHSVVPIEKITDPKFQTEWKKATAPFCTVHPSEKMIFFCTTCFQLICRDCTIVSHSKPDHECTDSTTQFCGERDALNILLDKSYENLAKGLHFIQSGEKGWKAIEQTSRNVQKEITEDCLQKIADFEKALQKEKKLLIKTICEFKNVQVSDIETQLQVAKDWVGRMRNTQDVTKKVLQENNPWELLAMSTDLKRALEVLQTESEEFCWSEYQLQLGMTFQPRVVPKVDLGSCEYVAEVVASDPKGNFILCHFDRPVNTILISIITKDSNYTEVEKFRPYQWKNEIPKYSELTVTAKRDGYFYVACGQVVAIFECHTRDCLDEKCIYENSPRGRYIVCMGYDARNNQVFMCDNKHNLEVRNSDLQGEENLNINLQHVNFVFPSRYDTMFGTKKCELVICSRKILSLNTFKLESPFKLESVGETRFVEGIVREASFKDPITKQKRDHFICFVVWEYNKIDPNSAKEYSTWNLMEFCTRENKVLAVLEGPKGKNVKAPAALLCRTIDNDEMELHLCSFTGEVTSYKRGKPQQKPVSYEEFSFSKT